MYRSLSGHRPRQPSPSPQTHRQRQQSLSIRTGSQQPQQVLPHQSAQHGTSTSPSQLPYPIYPLQIPIEKQPKARRLYHRYQMEETLDRIKHEPQSATTYQNSFLSVPGPQSITSRTSSRHNRATSISTSTYDGVTELSSVVSAEDGDESPSVKAKGELLSFDGVHVKSPRTRKRLSPVKKAKAALVRHLGSCWVCHTRKVPCPLDHHDLESLLQMTPLGNRTQSQGQFLQSPTTPSQSTQTSLGEGEQAHLSFSQSDALAGIEGNAGLDDLGPIATTLDIQLPSSYGDTQVPALGTIDFVAPALAASLYQIYQNGDMFPLGVLNNSYYCQYLDGVCNEFFDTDEELQQHFEISHFAFSRISPAHRYVCSECQQWNNDLNSPCYNCRAQGSIQLWVYGHYVRIPDYTRHASDGQDLQGLGTYPTAVSPMFFPGVTWNLGIHPFDGNAGTGGFNMQDGNLYGGPGNQAYGYNPASGSDAGGSQFQGSTYGGAQQFALCITDPIRIGFVKSRQFFANWKIPVLLLSTLVVVTFGFNYQWILCNAEAQYRDVSSKLQAQLPAVGFLVILASFALSLVVMRITEKSLRRQNQCVLVVLNDLSRKTNEGARDDILFMLSRILMYHSNVDHLRFILISMSADTHDKHLAHFHESTFMPLMNHVL